MSSAWSASRTAYEGGRFRIFASKRTKGGRRVEVTRVRNAPTALVSYGHGDPFSDAVAVLNFPKISPRDDWEATDLRTWMGYYSDLDVYWCPAVAPVDDRYASEREVISALDNDTKLVTPIWLRDAAGNPTGLNAKKAFEGFLASVDLGSDGNGISWQCQGVLYQLDRYLAKPFYPLQPWPLEALIADAFSRKNRPHLRWGQLEVHFPDSWGRKVPAYAGSRGVYSPHARAGNLWTAYTSRSTGSWDHALTGFVQDQLTVMITRNGDGVRHGNQWTVRNYRTGEALPGGRRTTDVDWRARVSKGRTPVLQIRDRYKAADFSVQLGAPGVEVRVSGDSTQSENIVFGNGTGLDGTVWRNAVINNHGTRTDYRPLAADRAVWPYLDNPHLDRGAFVSEANTNFAPGFDQPAAADVSGAMLDRDRSPGLIGSIVLHTDPSSSLSRWLIKEGMVVAVKGLLGSTSGIKLHIAAVTANPPQGTVELTVDSRFRDLLTVEEARVRTRDPLTPVKMLQVNRSSVMIEDLQAPWDYSAGSGFIPTASQRFFDAKPRGQQFPYVSWHRKYPPLHFPHLYAECHAGAPTSLGRWTQKPVRVLASEKGTIIRTEIGCYDLYGRVLKIPFHVSFYYVNSVNPRAMPHLNGSYSPYQNDAFEKVDPNTGVNVNPLLWPCDGFIIGWGNKAGGVLNRAGFWPGRETAGASPTGLFVDDGSWSFDMTTYHQYFQAANPPGRQPKDTDISLYAMFYAEHHEPVYFMGRLFRQNPGAA